MNAISELSSDPTTPLLADEVVDCFEALSNGRCRILEFNRTVLEACRADPAAAAGVLVLIEDYTSSGRLQQFNFGPMQRVLRKEVERRQPAPVLPQAEAAPATPAAAVAADDTVIHPPRSPEAPATMLRGRFVLQAEIGRGGVGTVYRALDRNRACLPHERQCVALKVLREEHARRPEALRALRREFYQAQSLSHPGIVNVFDFDRDGDIHFFTMELLDGESLGALMRQAEPRGLARDQALRILRALGEAVAYAHEHGVLHLDLKPGNVMVSPHGQVRVLDFGLAQTYRAEPWISEAALVMPAATPAYASCERLAGEIPDLRDDIYSFCCLAYELLNGRHPFDRQPAPQARGNGMKPRRIRGLTRRQWRALRSGLAWSREDRPDSMLDLLDALVPANDSPTGVARSSSGRPASDLPWRSIAALTLLALAVAAALGWNRLPGEVRGPVHDSVQTAEAAVLRSLESARGWITSLRGDATTAVSATTVPAPPRPRLEAVVITSVNPALMLASIEPSVDELPMPDIGTAATPAWSGQGPGALEFSSETQVVGETDSVARLVVHRRGGADGEISFDWHTVDDSATGGSDYATRIASETMAAGQTTATLLLPIVTDTVAEHTELFDVIIDATGNASLGPLTRTTVVIVDDD